VWLPPPSLYEVVGAPFETRAARDAQAAAALTAKAYDRLRELFPEWHILTLGDYGDPSTRIVEEAMRRAVDLVVVGSHGRSALGRLLLGSVSQKVVNEAPCSVRVARGRPGRSGPVQLVVGMNGSIGSEAAVHEIARRQWPAGSTVALVAFFGPYASLGGDISRGLAHIAQIHAAAADTLTSAGLDVTCDVHEGDPRRDLVLAARERDADCIVLGTRNLNARGRLLLGSVSTAVVGRAPCSVEVVRERDEHLDEVD
jgi:nucleotide-binding universal stress UspA family protein